MMGSSVSTDVEVVGFEPTLGRWQHWCLEETFQAKVPPGNDAVSLY